MKERESLQRQLALAKQLLNFMHEEATFYDPLNIPDHLKLKIAEQEKEIVGVETRLAQLDTLEQESRQRQPLQSHYISRISPRERTIFRNPYIAGPPITNPEMFFGRQADLEKIINLLISNFVMLIGSRRIGKTSLLHQLVYHLSQLENIPERFVPVLVNVEGTSESEFFHAIMEEIVDVTHKYLPPEAITNLSFDVTKPSYASRIFSRDLQVILKNLKSTPPKPSRLALLLDEMDTLNSFSLESQAQLRRIFQRFANRNLSVLVAGVKLQQHWAGESSPFYNMFVPVTLTPFPKVEARRLITKPVEDIYSYNDDTVERILEVTLGLPHRIQQLCLETVHHLQTTSPKRSEIIVEDVDIVLQTIHWLDEEEAHQLNLTEEGASIILSNITEGVIVQDLAGNIVTMNPAAEEILETIDDDFMRPHPQETGIETGQEQSKEQRLQLLNRLTELQSNESYRIKIGHRVLSILSSPIVTPDEEQLGSVVVLRDITREVESERLKDDFIVSMSHELRTPPTAIKGYNDLLRMTAADKLGERELAFIEAIDQNVTDLLNIIQQMLDLSQIDAGTLGIDKKPENLTELIETEAENWTEPIEAKELSFRVHLPDEPIWVESDGYRLTQVIDNLLSNAYKFTPPGGRIEVLVEQKDDQVQVDVKDTGVGISKEDQPFLFTRFFRAIHEQSTFEVSGAGLGLYMSQAIIVAHNGQIWMESEPNQGSTFSFTLPMMQPG